MLPRHTLNRAASQPPTVHQISSRTLRLDKAVKQKIVCGKVLFEFRGQQTRGIREVVHCRKQRRGLSGPKKNSSLSMRNGNTAAKEEIGVKAMHFLFF